MRSDLEGFYFKNSVRTPVSEAKKKRGGIISNRKKRKKIIKYTQNCVLKNTKPSRDSVLHKKRYKIAKKIKIPLGQFGVGVSSYQDN